MNKKISENIGKTKFKKLTLSSKPILLEVRTECCTQSNIIDKIIKKIEDEYNNEIHIARIDYETHRELFPDLKLDSFPTVLLMNGSKLVKSIDGTISRSNLKNLVNELIGSHLTITEKN